MERKTHLAGNGGRTFMCLKTTLLSGCLAVLALVLLVGLLGAGAGAMRSEPFPSPGALYSPLWGLLIDFDPGCWALASGWLAAGFGLCWCWCCWDGMGCWGGRGEAPSCRATSRPTFNARSASLFDFWPRLLKVIHTSKNSYPSRTWVEIR